MIEIPGGVFDEQGHLYRDDKGRRVLSVTQVFQMLGLVDYSGVRQEVLARKSSIGVAAHKAFELLLEGTLDWESVPDVVLPYVTATDVWVRNMGFTSIEREKQGIHTVNGMQFGYQYDHRGRMNFRGRTRDVILDLKTCDKESTTWALQTAAYAAAAPKLPAGQRYLRTVLHLSGDGRMKTHYYDDLQDENTFLYMLYCAIWKHNHGFTLEAAA